jgi:hypothetical protein
MAIVSAVAVQAALDPTEKKMIILKVNPVSSTKDEFYVSGVTAPYAGKNRWVITTNTDSAATQATTINNAMVG